MKHINIKIPHLRKGKRYKIGNIWPKSHKPWSFLERKVTKQTVIRIPWVPAQQYYNYNVNQNGKDIDFRIEGNDTVNSLFVGASADKIGIGTESNSGPQLYTQMSFDINAVEMKQPELPQSKVSLFLQDIIGSTISNAAWSVMAKHHMGQLPSSTELKLINASTSVYEDNAESIQDEIAMLASEILIHEI